jgi:hypothetical protein
MTKPAKQKIAVPKGECPEQPQQDGCELHRILEAGQQREIGMYELLQMSWS